MEAVLKSLFHEQWRALLDWAGTPDWIAGTWLGTLPGNAPPWTDTGLEVETADAITIFADGRIVVSEELGLWFPPRFALWGRIGEGGTIFNGPHDTFTTMAGQSGSLHLATIQGEWASRDGVLATPVEAYATVTGAVDVVVIRWGGDPLDGLRGLRELAPDNPRIAAEIQRLESPVEAPAGWHHLWFLGETEIFRATRDGIAIRAENDVGILQKPVSLALTPTTTLSWEWKIDRLPSTVAEDSFPTHNYLSVAVEFETGKDVTWYWSAALPEETTYTCPLPNWAERETHVVVRSGNDGLGTWQRESINVHAEAARIYGEAPKRIVAVWLIAVSIFSHGVADAEIRRIRLDDGERTIDVV